MAISSQEDLQALVAFKVPESRTLEYKQDLPGKSPGEKREFLADICAFANALGGEIVYGVTEERDEQGKSTGIPEEAIGLPGTNTDEQKLWFEQVIQSGISPRLQVSIGSLQGEEGPILTIRVPQSWAAPHMVGLGNSRFWSRNSAGKFDLDIAQIRDAFALSQELPKRIRAFRDERIWKILSGETPTPLQSGPKAAVHVVPYAAFRSMGSIDPREIQEHYDLLRQENHHPSKRFNLEGLLLFEHGSEGNSQSYSQVFRSGAIEHVHAGFGVTHTRHPLIASKLMEDWVTSCTERSVEAQRALGIDLPAIVAIALLDAQGFQLAHPSREWRGQVAIDRRVLSLPEILIERNDEDLSSLLRPTLDALWQCVGWEGAPSE